MNSTIRHGMKSTTHAIEDAKSQATQARTSLLQHGTQALELLGALRALEGGALHAMVSRFGHRRGSPLGPVMLIAGGAIVGGVAALLLAPSSGAKLRRRIAKWIDSGIAEVDQEIHVVERAVVKGNHVHEPV